MPPQSPPPLSPLTSKAATSIFFPPSTPTSTNNEGSNLSKSSASSSSLEAGSPVTKILTSLWSRLRREAESPAAILTATSGNQASSLPSEADSLHKSSTYDPLPVTSVSLADLGNPTSAAALQPSSTATMGKSASAAANPNALVPFWSTAFAVTMVFLVHGWLAETVILAVVKDGLAVGWFFALLTVFGQFVPSIWRRGWEKTPFRMEHFIVGAAHCFSLGLSNTGGLLVQYNTYALFKSAKVVFVMFVSWVALRAHVSAAELAWGLGLMGGLLVLTGADEAYSKESTRVTQPVYGAVLLITGVSLSALVSVGQQAALQRRAIQRRSAERWYWPVWGPPGSRPSLTPVSQEDEREALLFYSSVVSIIMLGCFCTYNGELANGLYFFRHSAGLTTWLAQISALMMASGGQRLVLMLNGAHGATATAAVLTLRKVASFASSVLVYPKPFYPVHLFGLTIVMVSSVMIQRAESAAASIRKAKAKTGDDENKNDDASAKAASFPSLSGNNVNSINGNGSSKRDDLLDLESQARKAVPVG